MNEEINILIVEDSLLFAQGLELLLEQHSKVKSIQKIDNYKDTMSHLKTHHVDLIFLDLNFETSDYDGFTIALKLRQLYPRIKIIVLTQHTKISHYNRLFDECKVNAYLDKRLGVDVVFEAIEEVMKGGRYVDSNIKEMLNIEGWMKASKRENEVIELLIQGLTQKEIGDRLHISPKTVEVHTRNLFQKFDVKNSIELVAKYVKYKSANRENVESTTPPFKKI